MSEKIAQHLLLPIYVMIEGSVPCGAGMLKPQLLRPGLSGEFMGCAMAPGCCRLLGGFEELFEEPAACCLWSVSIWC